MNNAYTPKLLIMLLLWLSLQINGNAQQKLQQKIPDKTRILFLLDASGSMLEPWGGPRQNKMTVAKSILTKIIDSLKQNNKVDLALRLYGHRSPREQNNCKDTWLEVPFKSGNHNLIIETINAIKPKGVTPITYSLEQAANDFPPVSAGYRNLIILITDGIESCGGDPCAMSQALQKKGVFLRPYIIGLGMQAEKKLDCVGKFINADTPNKFYDILNQALETSFAKTTVSIELQGANSQTKETDVNVTFLNSLTGIAMYDFVHYRNKQGNPDSVQVDPVVDYDIIVNTVPPVIRRNISITPGKHNVITVPVPQGNVLLQQDGRKDTNLQAIVRQKERTETINVQRSNEPFRYLAGKYELETLTLPRRKFTIEVLPNKTQNILIPAFGVVNFNTTSTGYGSLYEVKDDGTQEWVCNLNDLKPNFSFTMLPGKYKIVFRVKNTTGSKYTAFKNFTLKPGETLTVNVFK